MLTNFFLLITETISRVLYPNYTWWLDPVGSILISLYIIFSWIRQMFPKINNLIGRAATPDFIQRITKIVVDHDNRIQGIDKCYAYHIGDGIFVEVDIILNPNLLLKESHDIGEGLQHKIEKIEDVERCFVHIDYQEDGEEHKEIK